MAVEEHLLPKEAGLGRSIEREWTPHRQPSIKREWVPQAASDRKRADATHAPYTSLTVHSSFGQVDDKRAWQLSSSSYSLMSMILTVINDWWLKKQVVIVKALTTKTGSRELQKKNNSLAFLASQLSRPCASSVADDCHFPQTKRVCDNFGLLEESEAWWRTITCVFKEGVEKCIKETSSRLWVTCLGFAPPCISWYHLSKCLPNLTCPWPSKREQAKRLLRHLCAVVTRIFASSELEANGVEPSQWVTQVIAPAFCLLSSMKIW